MSSQTHRRLKGWVVGVIGKHGELLPREVSVRSRHDPQKGFSMHVLVSTKLTQGQRKSDFCFTDQDELVMFGLVCGSGKGSVDDGCGCQRSMVGVDTRKSTTTITVMDVDLSEDEYVKLLATSHAKAYELKLGYSVVADTKQDADKLLAEASMHSVGTVLEYREGILSKRDV